MDESNLSTVLAVPEAAPSAQTFAVILNESHMTQMFKFAEMMACGIATVPKHLQKNPADCLAVVMQATQWGMNPFAVAQKTHIVNGALGYEAQLVNAVLQSTKAIKGVFA
ncbi:MAG: recombinase RecT, partial [Polaromonas sp.]